MRSQLPPYYRAERDAFLQLTTNQDAIPSSTTSGRFATDPTAPANEAKDEHYRRLAYANEQFGFRGANNGWRTDRGMVYITLSAPKQIGRYLNTKYLRQMEIWFYQSGACSRLLFSVIFFKPSPAEDFRLYSPYSDRPEKLITSNTAVNDQRAVRMIQQDTNWQKSPASLSPFCLTSRWTCTRRIPACNPMCS